MSIEIRKNYRDDKQLRDSFNELSEKTFGLSFENWYQNGYWKDNYNPYSVIVDGKVVANVSVNRINTMMSGEKKYFIQLGTVMTDEEYRGRGFIREILKEIDQDYADQCDGMYLFANDSVLDFIRSLDITRQQNISIVKRYLIVELEQFKRCQWIIKKTGIK